MIRDLYSSLTAREQRAFRWSAVAVAAALWLSTAWTDPRILLTVPLVVGGFVLLVYKRRRAEPMTRPDVEDEDDWRF
jgi:hypothetical protein